MSVRTKAGTPAVGKKRVHSLSLDCAGREAGPARSANPFRSKWSTMTEAAESFMGKGALSIQSVMVGLSRSIRDIGRALASMALSLSILILCGRMVHADGAFRAWIE